MQITVNPILEKKIEGIAALLELKVDEAANLVLEKGVGAFSGSFRSGTADVRSTGRLASNGSAIAANDGTKLADRIRRFALNKVIEPARVGGKSEVVLRVGDLHRELGLRNRLPAVCAALGATLFLKLASVELLRESGPANGASKEFTYKL